jgi:hypothetical protein
MKVWSHFWKIRDLRAATRKSEIMTFYETTEKIVKN